MGDGMRSLSAPSPLRDDGVYRWIDVTAEGGSSAVAEAIIAELALPEHKG
jgi:hypothetical protein